MNAILFPLQLFSDTLSVKMSQLKTEKKRSDRLLYQMLPVEVARQLRQNRQVCDVFLIYNLYDCSTNVSPRLLLFYSILHIFFFSSSFSWALSGKCNGRRQDDFIEIIGIGVGELEANRCMTDNTPRSLENPFCKFHLQRCIASELKFGLVLYFWVTVWG